MVITIYRTELSLWDGDKPIISWFEYTFEPTKGYCSLVTQLTGFRKERSNPLPIEVKVPIGSKLVPYGEGKREFASHFTKGIDAHSVHYLAKSGKYGLSLIEGRKEMSA